MTGRSRFILPVAAVVLAVPLLYLGYWRWHPRQVGDPSPTALVVCDAINFPALFAKRCLMSLWTKFIPVIFPSAECEAGIVIRNYADPLVFLALIGVLWYLTGVEIDSRGRQKRAIVPSRVGPRLGVDLILILIGFFFNLIGMTGWRWAWSHPLPSMVRNDLLGVSFCMAWGLVLIVFYGHDFARCLVQARHT